MTGVTTKELFELAEIMSDAYDVIDSDDTIVWPDLTPVEQAAYAEGIRAVLDTLELRGWYQDPWFINDSELVWEPATTIPVVIAEPRQWNLIEDVPLNVRVTDCTGDTIAYHSGLWMVQRPEGNFHDEFQNDYTPFTEILSDRWERWSDVPVGVLVDSLAESATNSSGKHDRWLKVSDNTTQVMWAHGDSHQEATNPYGAYPEGPFVKVFD